MLRSSAAYGLFSIVFTGFFALLAWWLTGAPDLVGIDDAAITRAYAQNIANGHGFVFNVGGERVEGATSFLWTGLVAAIYSLPIDSALAILLLCYLITAITFAFYLAIAAKLSTHIGLSKRTGTMTAVLLLIGVPDFLVWSVFSMMETALWAMLLSLLVLRLMGQCEEETPNLWDPWLTLAAIALPLTRPEGVAIAAGLILLAILIGWRRNMALIIALLAAFAACVVLVAFRMWYFGYPLPNTYYAKVSSDRVQSIIDGAKFLASFLIERPFTDIATVISVVAVALAVIRLREAWAKSTVLIGCAIFGVFVIYAVLGGDHFALWRMYLPVLPLLIVLSGVTLRALLPIIFGWPAKLAISAGLMLYLGLSWLFLYQTRADVVKEYDLTTKGIVFGEFLNTVAPQPNLGVIAAGGIALSYKGEISDLMGLNWTVMAHANPIKEGYRNHASFDHATFYQNPPDLIGLFTRDTCQVSDWSEPNASGGPMKGIWLQPQFQQMYQPVVINEESQDCWNGFAHKNWLNQAADSRFSQRAWADIDLK